MSSLLKTGLVFALVGFRTFAGDPNLRREGAFWIQVETGSQRMTANSALHIRAAGKIVVKGTPDDQLTYKLTKRVKGGDEADARRRLNAFHANFSRKGAAVLVIAHGDTGAADLEVHVPRGIPEIIVISQGGAVSATDLDGSLRIESGAGQVALDKIVGRVTARTAGGDIVLGSMGSSVQCTSGGGTIRASRLAGEAVLETAGGDIAVEQVNGPIRCTTAGGGIRIAKAGATVVADTMGGPIEVVSAGGMIKARNSGGPIELGAAHGGAQCESDGGTIRVSNISGGLRASTAVGNIEAQILAGKPLTDSFLTTGTGDITLRIPSGLGVTVRARNESAGGSRRIVSDFSGIVGKRAGAAMVAEGAINGGGPIVRLATANGTIYIRRDK
jgi:DUF4097 and DUF4098 domain-containing protein YvlB